MSMIMVLKSFDLVGPMSSDKRRLVWVSAHVQKLTVSWIIDQVRCVCNFLNIMGVSVHKSMTCGDIYNWIYGLHGNNTGLVNLSSLYIVLV